MDGALLFMVIFAVGLIVFVAVRRLRREEQKKEIVAYVNSKRKHMTGKNRFLIDFDYFQATFADVEKKVLVEMWDELKRTGRIVQDPMDGEWVIK